MAPRPEERYLAGCCGLFCGLCPRFQSEAESRCLGCQLGEQHSWCSIYRCCVTKHGHFTCADCEEYPCERLLRVLGVDKALDSVISHKPAIPNLDRIRESGLDRYLDGQRERRLLVETLLRGYNEGRSMSFYCAAGALLPTDRMREALKAAEKDGVGNLDPKSRARAMRELLERAACEEGIDLKLRKGK